MDSLVGASLDGAEAGVAVGIEEVSIGVVEPDDEPADFEGGNETALAGSSLPGQNRRGRGFFRRVRLRDQEREGERTGEKRTPSRTGPGPPHAIRVPR
jgi:hypothetical protein